MKKHGNLLHNFVAGTPKVKLVPGPDGRLHNPIYYAIIKDSSVNHAYMSGAEANPSMSLSHTKPSYLYAPVEPELPVSENTLPAELFSRGKKAPPGRKRVLLPKIRSSAICVSVPQEDGKAGNISQEESEEANRSALFERAKERANADHVSSVHQSRSPQPGVQFGRDFLTIHGAFKHLKETKLKQELKMRYNNSSRRLVNQQQQQRVTSFSAESSVEDLSLPAISGPAEHPQRNLKKRLPGLKNQSMTTTNAENKKKLHTKAKEEEAPEAAEASVGVNYGNKL